MIFIHLVLSWTCVAFVVFLNFYYYYFVCVCVCCVYSLRKDEQPNFASLAWILRRWSSQKVFLQSVGAFAFFCSYSLCWWIRKHVILLSKSAKQGILQSTKFIVPSLHRYHTHSLFGVGFFFLSPSELAHLCHKPPFSLVRADFVSPFWKCLKNSCCFFFKEKGNRVRRPFLPLFGGWFLVGTWSSVLHSLRIMSWPCELCRACVSKKRPSS